MSSRWVGPLLLVLPPPHARAQLCTACAAWGGVGGKRRWRGREPRLGRWGCCALRRQHWEHQ